MFVLPQNTDLRCNGYYIWCTCTRSFHLGRTLWCPRQVAKGNYRSAQRQWRFGLRRSFIAAVSGCGLQRDIATVGTSTLLALKVSWRFFLPVTLIVFRYPPGMHLISNAAILFWFIQQSSLCHSGVSAKNHYKVFSSLTLIYQGSPGHYYPSVDTNHRKEWHGYLWNSYSQRNRYRGWSPWCQP